MERRQKLILTGLAGSSGFLLALAYPGWNFDLGFLVWVGFVPLLYCLNGCKNRPSSHDRSYMDGPYKSRFGIGFVAGLVYFLIIFRWLWSIYPLDTLGIQSKFASLIIVLLIYIISSAGMAAFWGFFGAAYGYWLQLKTPVIKPGKPVSNFGAIVSGLEVALIPAALFILLEYAGAYGFGLLWAGSGSLFGPHWTFGNLAYSLATNSLALKFSSYIGIYGIVFLILLINNALMVIFTRSCKNYHQRLTTVLSTMVVIMVVTIASFFPKIFLSQKQGVTENNRQVNFTIIQTNQPTKISPTPKEILSAFKEQLDLLKRAAKEHPESQLIVFPEASDFFKNLSLFLTGSQIPNYFSNLFKEPRLIIAGARIIDTDGRAYSRVFALDTQKDIIGFYDKRLLTPEGEFLSYPTKFVVNLLSKTKVSEFSDLREFGIGKKRVSTVNFRGQFSVAPLVCSELLAPSLARQTIEGTDIIVGMTSYGVFHGSAVFIKQNLANAQFRAAENRKPLITATNMGLSYAINSEGNVQSMTQNQGAQLLTGGVALNSLKSWYNRVGDFPVLVGSLVLVISFGLLTIFRRTKGGS